MFPCRLARGLGAKLEALIVGPTVAQHLLCSAWLSDYALFMVGSPRFWKIHTGGHTIPKGVGTLC